LTNRGFLKHESDRLDARSRKLSVIDAKHANPHAGSLRWWEGYTIAQLGKLEQLIAFLVVRCPTLRCIAGHEDATNGYTDRNFDSDLGGKLDPGPAFPWDALALERYGLSTVRFDYRERGWRVTRRPELAAEHNGPGTLPRTVEPGP
jgi:N-acetyl-anhydromuramyl-L-alanine amidase AmpD